MLKTCSNEMLQYVGQRKHVSQMSKREIVGLFKRLKNVEKNGSKWMMSGHALNRINEKGIQATYEDVVSTIHNATIIEYKIDENKYTGKPDERVVLRAKAVVNRNYNLNAVYSLTRKCIVTVWINHINDRHATLDWSIYNSKMKVFGV